VQVELLAAQFDDDAYAEVATWSEHVVLVYRTVLDREPTLLEFKLIQALRDHQGLARSDVLAIALRGAADESAIATLAAKTFPTYVIPDDDLRESAQRLESASDALLREAIQAARMAAGPPPSALARQSAHKQQPGLAYNTYFGFLHAHSHLSFDASGDVDEAYRYAREQGGLDFFALTDHAEYLAIWPWDRKWDVLREAADTAYVPGEYTTFYGFEWSNPFLGHISVINAPTYTDAVETFALSDFYDWITQFPEAFAHFNHPGLFNHLGTEFYQFDPEPRVFEQIGGIEPRRGMAPPVTWMLPIAKAGVLAHWVPKTTTTASGAP
jgi:hypothetical protein